MECNRGEAGVAGTRLKFTFTEAGAVGYVDLYEKEAPVTCRTLWQALERPVEVPAVHAMFAGPEIMMGLSGPAQTFDPTSLPPENQTCFPTAGECLWFYQGANMMKGLPEELWEIGVFYDNGGRIFGPLGWTPCTIFGRIVEGLDVFAAACRTTRTEGLKTVELARA